MRSSKRESDGARKRPRDMRIKKKKRSLKCFKNTRGNEEET